MRKKIIRDGKGRFTKETKINLGKTFSKEHKENLKKNHKGMLGKKHSNISKRKISNNKERARKISESLKLAYSEGRKINPSKILGVNKKNSDTHKKLYKEGKIKIWNKGLTKETNQSIKKISKERLGDGNPMWLGGKSFEPYGIDFNNKLKRTIRKRDNQICMLCGIHREKLKKTLSVHHINYDKKCNLPQNLISLCKKCHTQTNFNRSHWTKFFQSLLLERYNYEYSKEREIILEIKQ